MSYRRRRLSSSSDARRFSCAMLIVFNTSYDEKTIVKVAFSKMDVTSGMETTVCVVATAVRNAGVFDRDMDWGGPEVLLYCYFSRENLSDFRD